MLCVDVYPGLGQKPNKVLYLVPAVLILQKLNELVDPLFGILHKETAGVAEIRIVRIEDIGSKKTSQVDDDLFIGWHISLGEGTKHLIRMQLLVQLTLEHSVIAVLGKQRTVLVVVAGFAEAKARRHCARAVSGDGLLGVQWRC